MSAPAQIIRARVHDDGAAKHAFGSDQVDLTVRHRTFGVALSVSLEVAKVAYVTVFVGRSAVFRVVRVDYGEEGGQLSACGGL